MSKILITFLFCLLLFASRAQKLEEVIQQHNKAYNQSFWSEVQTLTASGTLTTGDTGFPFQLLTKQEHKLKILNEEQKWVYATDGKVYWKLDGEKNEIVELSPEETIMLDFVWDFASSVEKLNQLQLVGVLELDGKQCYWLSGKDQQYDVDYYIEKETGRLVKINYSYDQNGKTRYISKRVMQHRLFQGLLMNAVIEIKTEEKTWELAFDEYFVGDAIKDQVFQKPSAP
jgi:hypothetical protein